MRESFSSDRSCKIAGGDDDEAAGDQGYHDYDDGISPVDSDEEVSAVSEAVSKTISRPLERKVVMPIRRRHRFFRMREMMMTALKPGAQNGAQIIGKYKFNKCSI